MSNYPKQILTIPQLIQSYIDAGMTISSYADTEAALKTIGYYRLRGYCFHLYDNAKKRYIAGTSFSNVLQLYQFDMELSHILFEMSSSIEVALRARLVESLLTAYNDALVLYSPEVFADKKLFWKNMSSVSSEIARSNDVFVQHNFKQHDGNIPLWAMVEVASFGTLSKLIKNLKTGPGSAYAQLASYYSYTTPKGQSANPSKDRFTSWVQSVSTLRNMCAHNSRIYNRVINTSPQLLLADQMKPAPRCNGLYQVVLAMKYLRPSDDAWTDFVSKLKTLFAKYNGFFDFPRMNFPSDWAKHFSL